MTTTHNTITGPRYGNGESRAMPWDVMGSALTDHSWTSLDQALKDTGLDFEVEVWESAAYRKAEDEPMAFAEFLTADNSRHIVRPWGDGKAVVGTTGTRYTPIQNRAAFAVAEYLTDDYGATITGMVDFRHGAASLMVLDLGRDITLTRPDGGEDLVRLPLLVKNSHDGSSALTFALTAMRMACTNALPAALRSAPRTWKVSHTPNAQERVDLAVAAILKSVDYQERFTVAAQSMMDTRLVESEFAAIVANLPRFQVDADAVGAVADRRRQVQADLMNLWRHSPTLEGIRDTAWGGFNTITEYLDHYRPVKGKEVAKARAEGALDGPNVRAKADLFKVFSTL